MPKLWSQIIFFTCPSFLNLTICFLAMRPRRLGGWLYQSTISWGGTLWPRMRATCSSRYCGLIHAVRTTEILCSIKRYASFLKAKPPYHNGAEKNSCPTLLFCHHGRGI